MRPASVTIIPEALLTLAQRFNAGVHGPVMVSPDRDGWSRSISRPYGTYAPAPRDPSVRNAGLVSFVPSGQAKAAVY